MLYLYFEWFRIQIGVFRLVMFIYIDMSAKKREREITNLRELREPPIMASGVIRHACISSPLIVISKIIEIGVYVCALFLGGTGDTTEFRAVERYKYNCEKNWRCDGKHWTDRIHVNFSSAVFFCSGIEIFLFLNRDNCRVLLLSLNAGQSFRVERPHKPDCCPERLPCRKHYCS